MCISSTNFSNGVDLVTKIAIHLLPTPTPSSPFDLTQTLTPYSSSQLVLSTTPLSAFAPLISTTTSDLPPPSSNLSINTFF
ncbi:hypothetical protein Sjap_004685 [Stephania japonica]|uniref:Uncharacterized protein n=1 Tax=Stephania japonica TaxID=461633 RepID=A0AAP0K4X4_9MAGN